MMGIKGVLLAVGGVLALAAGPADAGFYFYVQRAPITVGAFAGLDRVNLILTIIDTPTATIGAVSIQTDASWRAWPGGPVTNALKFRVPSLGNPDVYAPQDVIDVLTHRFNPGEKGTFGGLPGGINVVTPEPNGASKPAYTEGLAKYSLYGFYTTPFEISRADAPEGIVISSAVVPADTIVGFSGTIDNDLEDANGSMTFIGGYPIPEPTGLALLGAAGAAMLGGRRQRACRTTAALG